MWASIAADRVALLIPASLSVLCSVHIFKMTSFILPNLLNWQSGFHLVRHCRMKDWVSPRNGTAREEELRLGQDFANIFMHSRKHRIVIVFFFFFHFICIMSWILGWLMVNSWCLPSKFALCHWGYHVALNLLCYCDVLGECWQPALIEVNIKLDKK